MQTLGSTSPRPPHRVAVIMEMFSLLFVSLNLRLSSCQSSITWLLGLEETNSVKLGHTRASFTAFAPTGRNHSETFFFLSYQETDSYVPPKRTGHVLLGTVHLRRLCWRCHRDSRCDWPGLRPSWVPCSRWLPGHRHTFTITPVVSARTLTLSVGAGEITGMMRETKQSLL